MRFSCLASRMEHQLVDVSHKAFDDEIFPTSVGLRSQTQKLCFASPIIKGRFLTPTLSFSKMIDIINKRFNASLPRPVVHQANIGDTLSIIYSPFYLDGCLVDAILNQPITKKLPDDFDISAYAGNRLDWNVRFLPTLCPHCGWDLEGEKDCLVPTCHNCETAWEIGKKGLKRIGWEVQPGEQDTPLYLPFWKISAQIPSMEVLSFADFILRTNQPMIPRLQWHEREMQFWIPAFKLRPKIFLQIGRLVTINQWRLQLEQGHSTPNLYPANLPKTEARQAIKVVLAACATSRRKIFPYLPEARIKNAKTSLAYLPFQDKGHDWFQPQTKAVISKNVLRFGRRL